MTAAQIRWAEGAFSTTVGRETTARRRPREGSREAPVRIDDTEGLLSGKALNYAVRGPA
ncbi:hypothetical protein ACIQAC_25860 [Streptomyces sp. NPDC088387]|uniref:hypothetical protein n=1 Tax=Streptomyces sp. NPDC088387 TaxID=3365859 RepID=UPI003817D6F3